MRRKSEKKKKNADNETLRMRYDLAGRAARISKLKNYFLVDKHPINITRKLNYRC